MKKFYRCSSPRYFLLWLLAGWLGGWAPRTAAAQAFIINATATAQPGDPVSLQGNFGASARFLLASSGASNVALPVLVQRAGHATVQIPTSLSLDMYRVWVEDAGQRSPEVMINRARGMHFDSPEVAPGGALRLFGRNLLVPGNTAQVRFQAQGGGAGSGTAQVDVSHSDAYRLALTAPAGLQPSVVYDVFVRNGLSGGNGEVKVEQSVKAIAAGSDAFGLGVPWAPEFTFAQNVYNVRTGTNLSQHATGNGTANDQPAIQAAIDAAGNAGGGVVYLPAGTYRIDYPTGSGVPGVLRMHSRVVLRGDGPQTIIKYGYTFDTTTQYWTFFFEESANLAGLADLTLANVDTTGRVPSALSYKQTRRLFLKNVAWDLAVGEGINLMNVTQLAIRGCTIRQGVGRHQGPLYLDGSTDIIVGGNQFTYAVDGLNMNYTQRVIFENNRVHRDGSARYPPSVTTHLLVLNFSENVALLNNRLDVINGPAQNKNDGEAIIAEGGGGVARKEAAGTVSAATATTLQGTQAWNALGDSAVVAIVKGPGLGQWRRLQNPKNATNSLTVTRRWDVIPAPTVNDTSRYSVFNWGARNWLVQGDTLLNNQRGITLYGNATTDVAIVGNVLRNSGSIDLTPSQQADPDGHEQFLPVYNVQILGNSVTADASALSGVFIGAHTSQYKQAKTFGTSVIGLEVRRNLLQGANKPAVIDAYFPEGYLNYLQYQPISSYVDQQIPAVLGSIFQNNTARNCKQALHLNTGSYDTYVCGTTLDGTATQLDDATIDGTNHASVGTSSCTATTVLRTPENPASTTAGLNYQYYEGSWSQLPDFSTLTPARTGTATTFDLSTAAARNYNYALQYTGYVTVPADGQYTFYTNSDDGSRLYIGATLVVDNDGLHGLQEHSGTIGLRQGTHALTVAYLQGGGAQTLTVSYAGPGLTKQALPAAALSRLTGGQGSNRGGTALAVAAADNPGPGLQAYPTPGPGPFTAAVTVPAAQAATLQLLDGLGRVVQQQAVQLRVGANQLPFQAPGAARGLYYLVLVSADGQRQVQKVLIAP